MRTLNRVILSMEIYAISDLATGKGLSIRQDIVAEFTPVKEERRQYEWKQEQPIVSDRRLWAEKLKDVTSAH